MEAIHQAIQNHFRWQSDNGESRGPGTHYYCPYCRKWEDAGHAEDCPVVMVEKATGTHCVRKMFWHAEWQPVGTPELDPRDAQIAHLTALAATFAAKYHEIADGHPPENFRGCTHPDCEAARLELKRFPRVTIANQALLLEIGALAERISDAPEGEFSNTNIANMILAIPQRAWVKRSRTVSA